MTVQWQEWEQDLLAREPKVEKKVSVPPPKRQPEVPLLWWDCFCFFGCVGLFALCGIAIWSVLR